VAAEYGLRSLLETIIRPEDLVCGRSSDGDGDVVIAYGVAGTEARCDVKIYASDFFGDAYLTPATMPSRPVARREGIPALYTLTAADSSDRFFVASAAGGSVSVDCPVDVVAGAFFLLSRYEEIVNPSADRFGRFPAGAGVAFQEGFLQEPVVNAYAEKILEMLRCAGFAGPRRTWWEGAPWAVALTHDVDQLYRFPAGRPPVLAIARRLTGRADSDAPPVAGLVRDYAQTLLRRKTDEYDCLSDMAAWEASIGVRASYYLLSDRHGRLGADYDVDSPMVKEIVAGLSGLGHEIGFHAGIAAGSDVHEFHHELQQLQSLNVPVQGGRQHYLRWQTPQTWRLWEGEGLVYDATLGYSAQAGFRCGTCLPFHPYDVEHDRVMSLWEWPLMFMDATYCSHWPEGEEALETLTGACRRFGGSLVLLWHNRNWSSLYAPSVRNSLQRYVQTAQAGGAAVDSVAGLLCRTAGGEGA